MRPAVRAMLVIVVVCGSSCVRYARADSIAERGKFDALWERDLVAFEHAITYERHTGSDDAWTDVAEAWLNFVNCDPVDTPAEDADATAKFVHRLLVAEDLRRAVAVYQIAAGQRAENALYFDVLTEDFFDRESSARATDLIEWPAEQEGWQDEVPTFADVHSSCEALRTTVLQTPLRPDDEESPPRAFTDWYEAYVVAADAVVDAYASLPNDVRGGAADATQWRTGFWVAAAAHATAAKWEAFAAVAERRAGAGVSVEENQARAANGARRAETLRHDAHRRLETAVRNAPDEVDAAERALAHLLFANYEVGAERTEAALSHLATARELGLSGANLWAARYLELRVAADAARWKVAAELADAFPPPDSRYHGATYYWLSVASKRVGRTDRFLNIAMKAFRDRDYQADPFLRALYWEALETLAEVPFEGRVVEMLEDMGRRGEVYQRVEEYARVSLDRGQNTNADAAARWLLSRQPDRSAHPRYHGLVALAAFGNDDIKAFEAAANLITHRDQKLNDALPARRRPRFFERADEELARLLRQMLPAMAEWGDGGPARQRRQRWLRAVVEVAQEFVRDTRESLARPQLTELYRLASQLLDDHPRGYAERVGEEGPPPLILGTVRVARADLADAEPEISLEMSAPYSLTLIPRDEVPLTQWAIRWPARDTP